MGPELSSDNEENDPTPIPHSAKGKRKASNSMNINPSSHLKKNPQNIFAGYEEILENREAGEFLFNVFIIRIIILTNVIFESEREN